MKGLRASWVSVGKAVAARSGELLHRFDFSHERFGAPAGLRCLGVGDAIDVPIVSGAILVHPPWTARRRMPRCLNGAGHQILEKEFVHTLPGAGIAGLRGGRLLGSEGITFDHAGFIIAEPARQIGNPHGPFAFRERYQFVRPAVSVKRGQWVALTGQGAQGYFHWMLDILPRLALVELVSPRPCGYFVPHDVPLVALESLARLGISDRRIQLVTPADHIRCDCLVVASNPSVPGNPPPWAIEFLRTRVAGIEPTLYLGECRKFVVSREHASCRRVLNEAAVMDALEPLGFSLIRLEDLKLADQIRLFREASHIVAPHGAGLVNVAFCGEGTRLLELFGDDYVNACFFALADVAEVDYTFAICQSVATNNRGANSGDMFLSSEIVQAALRWACE